MSTTDSVDSKPLKEDLSDLSKEELIERIRKLEFHVGSLRRVVKKQSETRLESIEKKARKKEVDFNAWKQRRIALRIMYLGWNYHGLAIQESSSESIEDYLFEALFKTCLIRDRKEAFYQKCGRTDKGVSAFCQIVSLNVRSSATEGIGVFEPPGYVGGPTHDRRMDYAAMLNKVLPEDIRVLAWSPVDLNFNARFGCESRTYRYFFPADNLDIGKMRAAAYNFIGVHKFSNFCKKARNKVDPTLHRTIFSISIFPMHPEFDQNHPLQLFVFEISASGFLWHQIRCIMTILFYVGSGKEDPSVVKKMLNTVEIKKPQYELASELPLCLYNATYKSQKFLWFIDRQVMLKTLRHLQRIASQHLVQSQMTYSMIKELAAAHEFSLPPNNAWIIEERTKNHRPLLTRPLCRHSWSEDGIFFEDNISVDQVEKTCS